jgi:hypothetical protein
MLNYFTAPASSRARFRPPRRLIPAFLIGWILLPTARARASDAVRVYIAGDSATVRPALDLAGRGAFTVVVDPLQADVLVLNGKIPVPKLAAGRPGSTAYSLTSAIRFPGHLERRWLLTKAQIVFIPSEAAIHNGPITIKEYCGHFVLQKSKNIIPVINHVKSNLFSRNILGSPTNARSPMRKSNWKINSFPLTGTASGGWAGADFDNQISGW